MNVPSSNNRIVTWVDDRLPVISMMHHILYAYPTPKNLNYWWNFGSLASFMLVVMIVSGLFLSMHYVPHTAMAFESVERIMRDVRYGWLLRYLHATGASMFFIVVYIHIFRSLYYGSYKAPRELLWWLGLVIYLLMMATGFLGHVLPWGQMSLWSATVITSMLSALPLVGDPIVTWLWGGFSVDNPTLNRFFPLHLMVPLVIVGVVFLHVWALHTVRSNNPLGIDITGPQDCLPFHPYYTVKNLFGIGVFLIVYMAFVFWAPDFFSQPDNYVPANPMVTPAHIMPEWYYLPFYAILRSVPDKLGGVLLMVGAILVMFALPWLDTSKVRSCRFRPVYKWFVLLFIANTVVLGYVGAHPPKGILILIGQGGTVWYFLHFLVITPLVGRLERPRTLPESISAPVLPPPEDTA